MKVESLDNCRIWFIYLFLHFTVCPVYVTLICCEPTIQNIQMLLTENHDCSNMYLVHVCLQFSDVVMSKMCGSRLHSIWASCVCAGPPRLAQLRLTPRCWLTWRQSRCQLVECWYIVQSFIEKCFTYGVCWMWNQLTNHRYAYVIIE